MLSTDTIDRFLSHVTYKMDWEFQVYDGEFEGQHFVIRASLPDAMNPDEETTLDIHSMLPPMENISQFTRWLVWRLTRIETHEVREWLKHDGEPLYDPHEPGAEHDRPRSL